jgi:Acetylornithine deacetylase/Succinyl-diaminopimelate desuccinylase and related deacylases
MNELLREKARGLKADLIKFYKRVESFKLDSANTGEFTELIAAEMKGASFDKITKDKAGNLIGIIKGYGNKEALVMVSHIDTRAPNQQKLEGFDTGGMGAFKPGIISSIYAGALIKRAILPLEGDLIVCCVPRVEACDFGIQYLFENFLKARAKRIKGVILCEPTDLNINLGHKGRMEYEIVVKGKLNRNFLENRGMNMLGTMFPLINELEKVSKELPSDFNLGRSGLRIKDVRYSGYQPQDEVSEFRIVVDRVFIPEESQGFILNKAKTIAKTVYKQEPDVTVSTLLAKERVRTYTGLELVSEKEFKPWAMESHNPFALESLKTLAESGFKSNFGYWKKIVTEGSYTYGQLKIPTIGFGAGTEDMQDPLSADKVERAVYGQSLIVLRNIGIPTFGWSSDEI